MTGELRFRTFTVNKMSPVSVLFADIVGFTKMSSNKTATHLVFLLNDLFARCVRPVLCSMLLLCPAPDPSLLQLLHSPPNK